MAVQITREAPTAPPEIPTEARERYRALIRKIKARRPDLASAVSTFQDESLEEELFRQFFERERLDSRAEEIDLFASDYTSIPVPISEFISDPKLAGGWYVENLFDVWKREICTVIEKGTLEWVLTGSIGAGKTSAAMLAQMYKLYVVTCMRNPCSFYSSTSITFGLYSAMRYLAYDVGANMLIMRLRESPYFRDVVGISEEEDDPKKTRVKIFNFPNNVRFIFGASQYHGMGQDVYGVIMDEVAFFEGNGAQRARDLYASIRTRITSRFKSTAGLVPGIMCLCSSANHEGDFLDEHVQNDALKDRIHVSRFALYDVKKFSPPTFRVLVGERLAGSKLLDEVRVDGDGKRTVHPIVQPEDIPEGARIENVPAEMYTEFKDDLQQSLKDISGIGMATDTVFFPNMDKVDLAWDAAKNPIVMAREHPFTVESTCLAVSGASSAIRLEEIFKVDTIFTAIDRFRRVYRPTLNPMRPRFIHIDLAETTCAAAIACVHLKGFHKIEQFDVRAGVQSEIVLPVIHVDFVLRIEPPKDMSEIDFEKILQFVFYLRDMGMPIGSVSFDQYQSHHSQQILEKAGIDNKEISLDRTPAPYKFLKQTINALCLDAYHYAPLRKEIRDLRRKTTSAREMILKPDKGSKDISDALAGAVYNLGHSPYLAEAALELPIEGGQADEKTAAGQQKKGGFRVAAPAPAPGLSGDLGWVISGTPGAERVTDIF